LPLVTARADAEFVPFSYLVDDVSLTVTFSPVEVNSPKPEVDTLLTVPIDPPAAGPDRAFDPHCRGCVALLLRRWTTLLSSCLSRCSRLH
jgi:hypothetical protein